MNAVSPYSARLKQAQKEAGLTNEEAARGLDVGLSTYVNWRHGREPRTIARRLAVARFYGKPLAWFYENDDGIAA